MNFVVASHELVSGKCFLIFILSNHPFSILAMGSRSSQPAAAKPNSPMPEPILLYHDQKQVHVELNKAHYRFPLINLQSARLQSDLLVFAYLNSETMSVGLPSMAMWNPVKLRIEAFLLNIIHKSKFATEVVVPRTVIQPTKDDHPPECHVRFACTPNSFNIARDEELFHFPLLHLKSIVMSMVDGIRLHCTYDVMGTEWTTSVCIASKIANTQEFHNEVQNLNFELKTPAAVAAEGAAVSVDV